MSTKRSMERTNLNSKNTNTTDNHNSHSNSNSHSDFEASVGMSRKWNAREAGREVAENTLKKLKHKPSFFLLFSTIHYEKHGGFQEFLNGVWDVLPEGTPLIGGTISGFINKDGVFSRGGVGLAYDGLLQVNDVLARGTRKNPKKTIDQLKKQLSNNPNNLLLSFLPGPSMPNFRNGEKLIITKNKALEKMAPSLLKFSTTKSNTGVGRELEVLEHLSNAVENDIVGCSTIDDNSYNDNYQFIGNKSYSDAIVLLEIGGLNYDLDTVSMMPMPKSWHKVNSKKTFGHIVQKIDGKTALSFYVNELGYSPDLIFDEPELVHRRFVFAPVLTKDQYGGIHPRCPGTFYGDSIGFGHPVFDTVGISVTDGKYIDDHFINFVNEFNQKGTNLLLIFSCAVMFEALGIGNVKIYEKILEHFDHDFLIIFGGGEILSEKDRKKGQKILEMSLTGVGFHN